MNESLATKAIGDLAAWSEKYQELKNEDTAWLFDIIDGLRRVALEGDEYGDPDSGDTALRRNVECIEKLLLNERYGPAGIN